MKLRLMDFIVCPTCQGPFTLEVAASERIEYPDHWFDRVQTFWQNHRHGGTGIDVSALWDSYCTEVITGELACQSCGLSYPIEGGIPRILPEELRTTSGKMGRGDPRSDAKLEKFLDGISPVHAEKDQSLFEKIQLANQSNYGYEWKVFSHEYDLWDSHYKKNYVSQSDEFFMGKLGLDAGCGMGRYVLPPINRGAEMVGVDLSNAIEAAYQKSLDMPTFHVIQGDIFNLPFREDCFDFAQSLGVIHITPNPEGALLSVKKVVRPRGQIFLYVYKSFEEDNKFKHHMLKIVTLVRRVTVRLPSNVLYYLLYLMIPVVLIFLYFPSWVFWQFPSTKNLSLMLPYNYEQYGHRRLRDMHMNLFDRFGNPVERRYNRQQMEDWLGRAEFERYTLTKGYGWTVEAMKPGLPISA